ncbi:MAG: FAD-dependent oxidoreductase [Betaproteobacteria bacterium]
MRNKKRIAIIGSGISGLGCAYNLAKLGHFEITIFEKESRIGGHSHTINFSPHSSSKTFGIDTGFLVFNEWTYPRLISFFKELQVPTTKSDMSFSVSVPQEDGHNLEWAGTNLNSVFSQRKNIFSLRFLRMLFDVIRFNILTKKLVKNTNVSSVSAHITVKEFLKTHHFNENFQNWYLLPMIGAIWSCPISEMLEFPFLTLATFCENHGLLNIINRPQWHTVTSGSREYVNRIVNFLKTKDTQIFHESVTSVIRQNSEHENISLQTNSGQTHTFDELIFACHSNEALEILKDPSTSEISLLTSIPYQKNTAYVHEDASLLPHNKNTWAAWNYSASLNHSQVCVHYLINKLQPLPVNLNETPVIVSLNPHQIPSPLLTHQIIEYSHPLFNSLSVTQQQLLPKMQGQQHTWFCGAWTGYGFHEDGLRSGEIVAELLNNLGNYASA